MKKIIMMIPILLGMQVCFAQTWNEWFRQKKTQIQYLVKQIAALKVYTDYLQKGYTIAKDGTALINDIKHGDFDLHNGYFNSLKSVNLSIKNYSKVSSIISHQISIQKLFRKLIAYCDQIDHLTSSEKEYIRSVNSHLSVESGKDIEELILVITSGELEMKEDERIKKIDRIYSSTRDKLSFSRSFSTQAVQLIHQRLSERFETERSKKIFGLQ